MFKYRKYNQDQESTNQYHSTVERKSASQASRPRKRKVDWQSSRRFIQFYVIVIVNIHSREISDWPKNGLPWLWTISYFSYNFRLVLKCSDYGLWLILTTSEETRRSSDCLQTTYTSSVKVHLVLPVIEFLVLPSLNRHCKYSINTVYQVESSRIQ